MNTPANPAQAQEEQQPAKPTHALFRVLSLDGGGSKGVYTLGVLKEVEALAGKPLCEVFDLIFGTSTGSIIAALIALGYRIPGRSRPYTSNSFQRSCPTGQAGDEQPH
jgi:patatin-like phospholipase/acyl hydrolase